MGNLTFPKYYLYIVQVGQSYPRLTMLRDVKHC